MGSNCSDEWADQRDCDCVGGAHGGCDPRGDVYYARPRARDDCALRDDVSDGGSDDDGHFSVCSPVSLI